MTALNDYLHCLEMEGKSASTLKTYTCELSTFMKACGVFTTPEVTAYYHSRVSELAPTGRAKVYSILNGFFSWMVDQDLLDKNPLRRVRYPKVPVGVPRPIPSMQLSSVDETIASLPLKYRVAFRLLRGLGLRAGELVGLNVNDFDLGEIPSLRVLGKGNKTRILPLNPLADYYSDVVEYLQTLQGSGPLFVSDRGRRESYENFRLKWKRVSEDYTLHQLRHTKATSMINAGVKERDVQVFMGHSSFNTTTRYTLGGDEAFQRLRSHV